MKWTLASLAVASFVGCASSPSDPVVGTGSFSRNGAPLAIVAVWAQASYGFFGSGNDSYGGYVIEFATSGAGLTCSSATLTLTSSERIGISTPQVFTPSSTGRPTLVTGDIPVVKCDSFGVGPPPTTVAELCESQPAMTAGMVTITSFDSSSIVGTFTATGPDAQTTPSSTTTLTGSFDAVICAK
jgi:hypothetical protein